MKNSNLFIKLSCIIPALLISCIVNLTAQNELIGYTFLAAAAYENSSYYVSNCKATWEEANEAATEMGGYLATFTSQWELEGLTWHIQNSPGLIPYGSSGIWIGLRGENGIYEWSNGESGTSFLWCCNEQPVHPDGAVIIIPYYEYYASWVSHPVSYETEYLVEFPFQPNCNNNPNKAFVCHNGNTICVNATALQSHLDHGDLEGPCGPCNTPALQAFPDEISEIEGYALPTMKVGISTPKEAANQATTSSDQFQIFPNPASAETHVIIPGGNRGTLRIFSLTEQVIHTQPFHAQESLTIDLSSFAAGIYLIEIRGTDGHYQKKIVKM